MMKRVLNAIAKRMPRQAKDRAEELLLGLRSFERLTVPSRSALTITCDDGELKDLDVVDVLTRLGVKGVFAVSPDLIGRPGFLSYAQLRAIREAGHEIAFHGTTHDPFTAFRDKGQLQAVCRDGVARLKAEGLGAPRTLIYPYGYHNRAVRAAMAPIFSCGFTTWVGINRQRTNRFAIRRIPFGAYTGKLPATEQWYRDFISEAARGNCWPTLMLHPSAQGHTSDHDQMLSRLVKFAQDNGVPIHTAGDHLETVAQPLGLAAGSVQDTQAN